MSTERWKPSVTVAAVIEDAGRYLLVEEHTPEGLRLNNPAGHLEPGESPEQGVIRETLEETARVLTVQTLLGVYLARFERGARDGQPAEDVTYLRFAFAGQVGAPIPGRALDHGIVRTVWLTLDELRASAAHHRSPLVLQCAEDHARGVRHALDLIITDASIQSPRPLRSS
jgi:8-oxo-dGTP pyrophosphatase MutT (NUDIX family)